MILVLSLFGFALIFFQYAHSSNDYFGQYLVIAHNYIYSDFPDLTTFSTNQAIFFVFNTTFVTLILTNMVISLMTDTYYRHSSLSLEKDNQEKLSLMLKIAVLKKQVLRLFGMFGYRFLTEEKSNKFLLVVEKYTEPETSASEDLWTSRLEVLKSEIARIASSNESILRSMSQQKESRELLIQEQKEVKDRIQSVEDKMDLHREKLDAILEVLCPSFVGKKNESVPVLRSKSSAPGFI